MKKQFKIGEYAVGGIISVEHKEHKQLTIRFLDYNSKVPLPGYGAIFDLKLASLHSIVIKNAIREALEEGTTSYYADKVMEHIYKSKK